MGSCGGVGPAAALAKSWSRFEAAQEWLLPVRSQIQVLLAPRFSEVSRSDYSMLNRFSGFPGPLEGAKREHCMPISGLTGDVRHQFRCLNMELLVGRYDN